MDSVECFIMVTRKQLVAFWTFYDRASPSTTVEKMKKELVNILKIEEVEGPKFSVLAGCGTYTCKGWLRGRPCHVVSQEFDSRRSGP